MSTTHFALVFFEVAKITLVATAVAMLAVEAILIGYCHNSFTIYCSSLCIVLSVVGGYTVKTG